MVGPKTENVNLKPKPVNQCISLNPFTTKDNSKKTDDAVGRREAAQGAPDGEEGAVKKPRGGSRRGYKRVDRSKFHFVAKDLEDFRPCTQEVARTGFLRARSNFNACEKVGLFALEKIAPVEAGVSRKAETVQTHNGNESTGRALFGDCRMHEGSRPHHSSTPPEASTLKYKRALGLASLHAGRSFCKLASCRRKLNAVPNEELGCLITLITLVKRKNEQHKRNETIRIKITINKVDTDYSEVKSTRIVSSAYQDRKQRSFLWVDNRFAKTEINPAGKNEIHRTRLGILSLIAESWRPISQITYSNTVGNGPLRVYLLKFSFVVVAVLALTSPLNAWQVPRSGNGALADEAQDLVDLVPLDDMVAILLEYVAEDAEFQRLVTYLQSDEFRNLIADIEAMPEFTQILNYIQAAGLDIYSLANKVNDFLHLKELTPPLQRVRALKITGGIRGFLDDIEALMPRQKFIDMWNEKKATSTVFRDFVNFMGSTPVQTIVNRVCADTHFHNILVMAKRDHVDVAAVKRFLESVLGLTVPCTI
ncbi:Protein G12 [Eufriesea mexicana]|nr:Protein G12 [Eufriesea mexicana]